MTNRERFLCALFGGPVMPPDALILLAGEDALPRMAKAVGRFLELKHWAMQKALKWYQPVIVITGGKHDPPRWWGAEKLTPKLIGKGISHNKILIENEAQNTRGQAEETIELAVEKGWKRLMLVASPYHTPRAFLTFLGVLQERDLAETIELLPDIADQTPWFGPPDGMETNRIEIMDGELDKIDDYPDVASYEDGLRYLEFWENHVPEQGHKGPAE